MPPLDSPGVAETPRSQIGLGAELLPGKTKTAAHIVKSDEVNVSRQDYVRGGINTTWGRMERQLVWLK